MTADIRIAMKILNQRSPTFELTRFQHSSISENHLANFINTPFPHVILCPQEAVISCQPSKRIHFHKSQT
jgi:hypothetical protein